MAEPFPLQAFQQMVMTSPMAPVYTANMGQLGLPVMPIAGVGNGLFCNFINGGCLFWSPATGTHRLNAHGALYAAWQALGGATGPLGFPTSDENPAANGGYAVDFASGASLYWTQNTGAHLVQGIIKATWLAMGGPASAPGYPTCNESPAANGGRFNDFANGASLYWTPNTGAHLVHGAIKAAWMALGGPASSIGYPVSDETWCPPGGFFNRFASGAAIIWSQATGAHVLKAAIYAKWLQANGASGSLGFPTTDEAAVAGGVFVNFQNSYSIYWSQATGAHMTHGPIRDKWLALGGPGGGMGFPVSDELLTGDNVTQDFQNGGISWTQADGAVVVPLASQEEQLLSNLGASLSQAVTAAYGAGLAGSNLAFLSGSLPVSNTLVQDGQVNPAQVLTWLASTFNSPFLQTVSGNSVLGRDDAHGTASQIYEIAITGAMPIGSADDPAWARLAAEIASAKQSMGSDASSRMLTCSPADWPLSTPAQVGYWTPFDHAPTATSTGSAKTTTTATGAPDSTQNTVQPIFWRLRANVLATPAALAAAAAPASTPAAAPPTLAPRPMGLRGPMLVPGLEAMQSFAAMPVIESLTSASAPSITVHLEYACVTLAYTAGGQQWWNESLLSDPGWYLPGMAHGALLPAASGPVPCVYGRPVAFVLVRNVSVTGVWTQQAQTAMSSPAVSLGPISLSGSIASASGDGVTVTYRKPGMQVVALFCSPLPVLPPNDSPTPAPVAATPVTTGS